MQISIFDLMSLGLVCNVRGRAMLGDVTVYFFY